MKEKELEDPYLYLMVVDDVGACSNTQKMRVC